MRFIVALFILPVLIHALGCSSNTAAVDAAPYDTLQLCYADHHGTEGFPTQRALEICCIDHPIGGAAANTVCGETLDACKAYITANLTDPADPTLAADIDSACSSYLLDRAG